MAYDIYGDELEDGNCEVHPWIAMEYPCPRCQEEIAQQKEEQEAALKKELENIAGDGI